MAGVLIYPRGAGMLDEIGDVDADNLVAPEGVPVAIGALDAERVLIALPLPYGRWLTAEISLALFLTAADAFALAHGDPRGRDVRRGPTRV
jgi:hypothetical protein